MPTSRKENRKDRRQEGKGQREEGRGAGGRQHLQHRTCTCTTAQAQTQAGAVAAAVSGRCSQGSCLLSPAFPPSNAVPLDPTSAVSPARPSMRKPSVGPLQYCIERLIGLMSIKSATRSNTTDGHPWVYRESAQRKSE